MSGSESWQQWAARVAEEVAALPPEGGLRLTVTSPSAGVVAEQAREHRRGWRRVLAAPEPPPAVPDACIQVSRVDGMVVLGCIADTEFEGVTDLSVAQVGALQDIGWERDGDTLTFVAVFTTDEMPDAAELLSATLRGPLGAGSADRVETRRT